MGVTGPRLQATLFEKSRPGRGGGKIPHPPKDALDRVPAAARRQSPPALPELNEPEVVRHYVNLSQLNFAIDTGFYPLGSCTMKFNPKLNEWAARLPGFASLHPLAPDETAQGTLQLLWEEHRAAHPNGFGYSRFCDLYRAWEARLSPTMRQTHVAGERLFVDYAGTTLEVINGLTGEVMAAQLFVAALGASSYTYAEATWTQGLADWIGSHTRAFAFVGGVTAMVVSDNLKSGITKACFYEPAVNRSYAEMAAHYDTAIVPARPRKPRDKAKVEVAVLLATRWIIAKLRNRQFFSLTDLNDAIRDCVTALNARVTRHLGTSRRSLFDEIERPALKPLPAEPYTFAQWKECRAGLDYHVEVEKHYYSVPHQLLREKLWARITTRTVELFHHGKRVAPHLRSFSDRKHTRVREHMPSSHQRYADWTPGPEAAGW